jgi:hypothetical protein
MPHVAAYFNCQPPFQFGHSVWSVDLNDRFLIAGCTDRSFRAWERSELTDKIRWKAHFQGDVKEHRGGIRYCY